MSGRSALLCSSVLLCCTGALVGCDSGAQEPSGAPAPLSRAALEQRVAGSFTADDPHATIQARCEGGLDVRRGATRDCSLDVAEESADVHVVVSSVSGRRPLLRITPYIPADRLGDALRSALSGQGYHVESVTCDDELTGEPDETTSCTATPAAGEGRVDVHVTKVDGLMVNFDYEVVR